jgi:muramoyltetrapeptide carboxypeptidase
MLPALVVPWVVAVAAVAEEAPPLYPKALARGDTIAFIAPAKYLDKGRVSLAKRRLEEMGFRVRTPATLFRRKGFLAGSDEERAAELMAAFSDPQIDAIFPGTGGYGTTRIVDKLDYEVIRRNPKVFVGFSDITALHIAINQRAGLVTFHSPNPEFGLGGETNLSPFAARWFWRALLARNYGDALGDQLSPGYAIEIKPGDSGKSDAASLFEGVPRPITLHDGKGRGRLIGGNLSVVHALMGTPYEIQTDGKILFLEDVGEAPYRVDRMLNTLRLAGKFDHVAGVILGAFTARDEEPDWDDDATIDDVLGDYFKDVGVPVLGHFPIGHVRYNATLPVGALAELDATRQTLQVLENPVTP